MTKIYPIKYDDGTIGRNPCPHAHHKMNPIVFDDDYCRKVEAQVQSAFRKMKRRVCPSAIFSREDEQILNAMHLR